MTTTSSSFCLMKLKRRFLKRTRLHKTGLPLPKWLFVNRFPDVPGAIHSLDLMLSPVSRQGLDHYLAVGRSAIENVEATFAACGTGWRDIRACLDLPCGHGRVLRWIAGKMDPSAITACEIDRQAADFCHSEFGAQAYYSNDDPRLIEFPARYDLIWVGSLFSHLDAAKSFALFEKFAGSMNSGGLMIFTTQGESCFSNPGLAGYGKMFPPIEARLRAEFARDGWCHVPYQPGGYYGMAIYSEAYMKRTMAERFPGQLSLARYAPRGWDNHQDVWSFRKT